MAERDAFTLFGGSQLVQADYTDALVGHRPFSSQGSISRSPRSSSA